MSFNFGHSPFKYKPLLGFVGFSEAPESVVVPNQKSSGAGAAPVRKLVSNAPQAIIIEVVADLL